MKNFLIAAVIFCITSLLANKSFSAERKGLLGLFKVGDCVSSHQQNETGIYEFTIYKNSPKNCTRSYEEIDYGEDSRGWSCKGVKNESCPEPKWNKKEVRYERVIDVSIDYVEIENPPNRWDPNARREVIPVSLIGKIKIEPWHGNYECEHLGIQWGFRNCK